MDLQFTLLVKALTFDRNLRTRVGSELVIGVVYQSGFKASRQVKDEFLAAAKASPIRTVDGTPIGVVPLELQDRASLVAEITKRQVDILYIAPLRAVDVGQLTGSQLPLSMTGVPEYVRSGAAIGVDIKAGKPSILVNLPASRAAGADFSSQLLKLAQVLR